MTPRQENGILLGHASADQSAYVFVIRRCLKMNGPNLRPVEDTIGQPMLQISKGWSALEIAKRGITRRTLKLRIVHHQFQSRITSRCSKDGHCLKEPIRHRIGKVSPLYFFH